MSFCIDEQVCKGCGICVANCAKKILELSDRRNAKGANIVEQTEPEKCVECRICQDTCPDLAIWICSD